MGRLQDLYISRMVAYLAREGERIANEALLTKQSQNDTMNQADAYGYAVFFDGMLKKKGYAAAEMSGEMHKGWEKYGIPDGTGRDWLNEFFAEWRPKAKGFVLIVVNAAFYSRILEEGTYRNRNGKSVPARKYRIITQIASEMKDLQGKFKGSVLSGHNVTIS